MRKLFVVLFGAMMACAAYAQVLEEGESALVYYSPRTWIKLDFIYTVESYEPGVYAEYAEEMLGATEAILEHKKVYRLKDVKIGTRTVTDYNRPHKVNMNSGIPMLLTINEKGLLTGYNVPAGGKKEAQQQRNVSARSAVKYRTDRIKTAPIPEEALKARSLREQAQEVAKQILQEPQLQSQDFILQIQESSRALPLRHKNEQYQVQ